MSLKEQSDENVYDKLFLHLSENLTLQVTG